MIWGMFLYHVYLVWAGMTTSESSKWAEWREEIAQGSVYSRVVTARGSTGRSKDSYVNEGGAYDRGSVITHKNNQTWPVKSKQALVVRRPTSSLEAEQQEIEEDHPRWQKVAHLNDIDNIYDLGFWANLMDVFYRH